VAVGEFNGDGMPDLVVANIGHAATVSVLLNTCVSAGSAQWQAIGPHAIPFNSGPLGAGKLQAFAVNLANPLVMYAGGGNGQASSGPASQAGVFKTTDGASTWTNANTGLTDSMIGALWLNQANPDIVLAGTWYAGIFRSADAGAHWTHVNEGCTTAFRQLGQAVYAATTNGVAESLDAGATWVVVKPTTAPVYALAASGTALYAGLGNGDVLFRATPTAPWQTIMTNAPYDVCSMAADPTSSQTLYVACSAPGQVGKLYATYNAGGNWALLSPEWTQVVAVDDAGTVYAGYDGGLKVSTNRGASWSQVPEASWDNRFLMPWPGTSGKLVIGGDQGLFLTTNSGGSWVGLHGRIASSLLSSVAVSGSTILTGVQDYGPILSFDGGENWQQHNSPGSTLPVGENGFVRFNPGNPSYAYAYTGVGLQYSSDGGHTFNVAPTLSDTEFTFKFASPPNQISVDKLNPSNVYVVAKSGILKSSDWGATWAKPPWPFTDPGFVVVSPADSRTIFVSTQSPQPPGVYVTHDGGSTWTNCDLGGDLGTMPVALDIDPSNPNKVLMGEWIGRVLLSTNGGITFVPNNAGLPANSGSPYPGYVYAIGFHPGSTNGVVAMATGNGIYLSAGSDTTWTNISGNAIPKQFTDLAWSGTNLYAATYGEGVLKRGFPISVAELAVTSANELVASGNRGGPFAPAAQQFSISNAAGAPLKWTANADQDWLTVTPNSGTNSGTVTVSINDSAKALYGSPSGITYTATVAFGGNGGSTSRRVQLTVYDNSSTVLVPLGIQRASGPSTNAVRVLWNPAATRSYQAQWATNVDSLVWFALGWPFLGSRSNSVTDFTQSYPRKFYRVAELSQPVIPDPQGNLIGDTTRTFMDIVATTLRPEGTNFTLDVQMAGPFPSAAQMDGGKRFDVMWFVDIDRNRATGLEGNDYNIHLYLDQNGWHYWWLKSSSVSQADGIVNVASAFKITVVGDRATLTFPQTYLPSHSFEMWAGCFSGNAPSWTPITGSPNTARAVFNF